MSLYSTKMGDHLEIIIFYVNFTDFTKISLREFYKSPIVPVGHLPGTSFMILVVL